MSPSSQSSPPSGMTGTYAAGRAFPTQESVSKHARDVEKQIADSIAIARRAQERLNTLHFYRRRQFRDHRELEERHRIAREIEQAQFEESQRRAQERNASQQPHPAHPTLPRTGPQQAPEYVCATLQLRPPQTASSSSSEGWRAREKIRSDEENLHSVNGAGDVGEEGFAEPQHQLVQQTEQAIAVPEPLYESDRERPCGDYASLSHYSHDREHTAVAKLPDASLEHETDGQAASDNQSPEPLPVNSKSISEIPRNEPTEQKSSPISSFISAQSQAESSPLSAASERRRQRVISGGKKKQLSLTLPKVISGEHSGTTTVFIPDYPGHERSKSVPLSSAHAPADHLAMEPLRRQSEHNGVIGQALTTLDESARLTPTTPAMRTNPLGNLTSKAKYPAAVEHAEDEDTSFETADSKSPPQHHSTPAQGKTACTGKPSGSSSVAVASDGRSAINPRDNSRRTIQNTPARADPASGRDRITPTERPSVNAPTSSAQVEAKGLPPPPPPPPPPCPATDPQQNEPSKSLRKSLKSWPFVLSSVLWLAIMLGLSAFLVLNYHPLSNADLSGSSAIKSNKITSKATPTLTNLPDLKLSNVTEPDWHTFTHAQNYTYSIQWPIDTISTFLTQRNRNQVQQILFDVLDEVKKEDSEHYDMIMQNDIGQPLVYPGSNGHDAPLHSFLLRFFDAMSNNATVNTTGLGADPHTPVNVPSAPHLRHEPLSVLNQTWNLTMQALTRPNMTGLYADLSVRASHAVDLSTLCPSRLPDQKDCECERLPPLRCPVPPKPKPSSAAPKSDTAPESDSEEEDEEQRGPEYYHPDKRVVFVKNIITALWFIPICAGAILLHDVAEAAFSALGTSWIWELGFPVVAVVVIVLGTAGLALGTQELAEFVAEKI